LIFTKENLVDTLRHNIVTVTFTKVDGTERVMKCTLMSEHIPNAPSTNGEIVLKESSSKTISVWDTEASGWRSFRVDNVKSISMG
jgi:hypothetical protein